VTRPAADEPTATMSGAGLSLKRSTAIVALCVAAASTAGPAWPDDALDARLKSLENQLRCLVCQNQTLAESSAPLAEDLRREVRELAASGKSDDDIRGYLVARYGDFVLYKPPMKPTTWLLWLGPFALLAGGALVWWNVLRRRSRMNVADENPTADESAGEDASTVARARALLDE
jgi:cytochrome c-type biogenesis protein CcmH